jgi:antitoxin (DNA-binding transcriptional repressor) of toxin-antitoxin stability system
VTEINVVVARIMPRRVKKLRSLFLFRESMAIRPASTNEALAR